MRNRWSFKCQYRGGEGGKGGIGGRLGGRSDAKVDEDGGGERER